MRRQRAMADRRPILRLSSQHWFHEIGAVENLSPFVVGKLRGVMTSVTGGGDFPRLTERELEEVQARVAQRVWVDDIPHRLAFKDGRLVLEGDESAPVFR